ncbi:Lrp/AsnC family transcriptional regulator [Paenibacillus sp. M1]|uniref:Lrp/AsnC family transcriptional regulator n=1 Tax=Paenibacillus haidiansis TaxID=1574488 RepID=A0ABU7VU70_9BACL
MDAIDLKIIELLKRNGRMTSSDIGKDIHLSVPSVTERIRKLEEKGVIEKFTVRLNREAAGQRLLAFISVILERPEHIAGFKKQVLRESSVLECHHLAGDYDYLVKIGVPDMPALEQFISDIKQWPGVVKTKTTIVLSTVKEE